MEYASVSRQLARFVDKLSYKDLSVGVMDRVKGRILHGVCTAFAGYEHPMVQAGKRLILNEEKGTPGNTTILGANAKASKLGAAFVNSMMFSCRNQHDSYRMLIHPSAQVLPSTLAVAENDGVAGKDMLVALAAGYEVLTRLASNEEYVLDAHAHGFRASPLFGVFGAAAATGKLMGLSEDQLRDALGFAATFAAGTAEGPRG
ncbi:MAG: MmgE/PrpD family protein, partial [Chloroflexota bacterium]